MALSDRKKGPVAAVSGDKLIVRPRFDDASVLKVTDHRRVADGCESVRDDNRGASARETGERILNGGLGERIEGARRLVKNKNWGILEEHAGDRDTLLPRPPRMISRRLSTRRCETRSARHFALSLHSSGTPICITSSSREVRLITVPRSVLPTGTSSRLSMSIFCKSDIFTTGAVCANATAAKAAAAKTMIFFSVISLELWQNRSDLFCHSIFHAK